MVAFEFLAHAIVLYTREDLLLILGHEDSAEFLSHYPLELLLVAGQWLIRLCPRLRPSMSSFYTSAFLPQKINT